MSISIALLMTAFKGYCLRALVEVMTDSTFSAETFSPFHLLLTLEEGVLVDYYLLHRGV